MFVYLMMNSYLFHAMPILREMEQLIKKGKRGIYVTIIRIVFGPLLLKLWTLVFPLVRSYSVLKWNDLKIFNCFV
jgi:hypothetical protein